MGYSEFISILQFNHRYLIGYKKQYVNTIFNMIIVADLRALRASIAENVST